MPSSHIVIGVHGSNMLLPSAHAGAVIELLPEDRSANLAQDIIPAGDQTMRETMFRYRFMPLSSQPGQVADTVGILLEKLPQVRLHFARPWNQHPAIEVDPSVLKRENLQALITTHWRQKKN